MTRVPPILLALAMLSAPVSGAGIQAGVARNLPAEAGAAARTPSVRFQSSVSTEEPSFRRHVVPLMSRLGCSGRECHGSFQGRGGFQLSLFGYDFDKDHTQITKDDQGDEGGVRVSLDSPAQSLLLKKGAALMPHKGKERFAKDSWEYNLLLKWISTGAKIDVAETGEFDRLEIFPKEILFRKEGDSVQLKVLAHWKDGTVEDVTEITRFRSNDDAVASVSDTGRVQSKGKGDSHVVAFYDNGVLPVPVLLPVSSPSKYPKNIAAPTRVDELVNAKLRSAGIIPAPVCTDSEFLRRASLDVTGTLPAPAEIEAFLADASPDKRRLKIEELLGRPGYAAWWTTKLCDFTGNNPTVLRGNNLVANGGQLNFGPQLARQWFDWIYARVAQNKPYDELAAGIVLGSMRSSPDQPYEDYVREMAGYFRTEDTSDFGARETMPWFWARQNVAKPEDKALAFAHTFLGVRIECAQCHKHPFDQWTKQDFAQFQAFFTTIAFRQGDGKKGGASPASPESQSVTFEAIREEIRKEAKAKVDTEFLARDLKRAREHRDTQFKEEQLKAAQTAASAATVAAASSESNAVSVAPSEAALGEGTAAASGGSSASAEPATSSNVSAGAVAVPAREESPLEPLPMSEAEKVRREADLRVAYQRAGEAILAARIKKGEPLPWADLAAQTPKLPKAAKRPVETAAVSGGSRVMTPKLLGGEQVMLETFDDVRKPLMAWLRASENPYFARAWVNRVWANYFGRGLVEPADDLNLANAPSNAALFDYLSTGFASHGFDMKWLHREILLSNAYQRSWKTNETNKLDEKNFSHALIRRLPAELVYDAIMMATDTAERLPLYALQVNERAIGAAGTTNYVSTTKGAKAADSYALNIFGKPARQTNCDCERVTDPTLLQTIYTRNDPTLLARIDNKRGTAWIESVLGAAPLKAGAAPVPPDPLKVDQLVREIYLRTVSRPPSVEETGVARGDILASASPVDGARELLWTLLNTREFLVNH